MTREEARLYIIRHCNPDYPKGKTEWERAVNMAIKALEQPEQRWIPCGKCIHADGKNRWCKVLDRTINEDYFCYWAEPFREEGEANEAD